MVASRINLFSYWIIGLPFGALITFKIQRVEGLFAGLALAVAFAASLMLLRIWRCDWSKRVEEAQDRMASSDAIAGLSNIEVVPEDTDYA
jgi:Na+-driven multidrug efflux pump